jgi:drug/metabolite transporter (DMT)-like permease
VHIRYKYNPIDFSNDGGLLCGVVLLVLSGYYYAIGYPSYTWYNFWVSFLASIFQMITSLVGLNATVKGLGGPTSAIMQTQSVVCTILNCIFLGLIPTIWQAIGSLLAISGVAIMMIFK